MDATTPESFVAEIDHWIKTGGEYSGTGLHYNLTTLAEAGAVIRALKSGDLMWFGDDVLSPNFFKVIAQVQSTYKPELEEFFKQEASPLIHDFISQYHTDDQFDNPQGQKEKFRASKWHSSWTFALKVLAGFGRAEDNDLIIEMTRNQRFNKDWVWSTIFDYVDRFNPEPLEILEALRAPLPENFCNIAFLDFCNNLAFDGRLKGHPFDTGDGERYLQKYLNPKTSEYSHAMSAVMALPFLTNRRRKSLILKARQYPERQVRREIDWAQARLGDRAGQEFLKKKVKDIRFHTRARKYLSAINFDIDLSQYDQDSEFMALREFSDWLSDEQYFFGQPPSRLKVVKRETLFWPDDSQKIEFLSVKYMGPKTWGEDREAGVGVVCSVGHERYYDYEDKLYAFASAVSSDKSYQSLVSGWPDQDWCEARLRNLNPKAFP